jgi:hypothetical protein
MRQVRFLVEQQGQLIALDGLLWSRLASEFEVGLP